ncbi:MAG: nucleotide pyrophosphatase/phosphodiesterase family protein, partial [Lentisphaeria bacterium]
MKKLLVVQIAGLGWDFLEKQIKKLEINWQKAQTVTPAVTCSVQASFKTGLKASDHGIVANGFFFSQLNKPLFWEQNSNLIEGGDFIWKKWQDFGKQVGVMFWQQSLGHKIDLLMSPAPIHKHHGGMIQDCYDLPRGLYDRIKGKIGGFDLKHYWGPLASEKSTKWIVNCTVEVMRNEKPDLLFTYLPHLDYELQKSGPDSKKSAKAYVQLEKYLEELLAECCINGYEILLFGDYAIMNVDKVVYPNKILRDEKLLNFRILEGMLYPDYYRSEALAIVDHQVAHVKLFNKDYKNKLIDIFKYTEGIKEVFDG